MRRAMRSRVMTGAKPWLQTAPRHAAHVHTSRYDGSSVHRAGGGAGGGEWGSDGGECGRGGCGRGDGPGGGMMGGVSGVGSGGDGGSRGGTGEAGGSAGPGGGTLTANGSSGRALVASYAVRNGTTPWPYSTRTICVVAERANPIASRLEPAAAKTAASLCPSLVTSWSRPHRSMVASHVCPRRGVAFWKRASLVAMRTCNGPWTFRGISRTLTTPVVGSTEAGPTSAWEMTRGWRQIVSGDVVAPYTMRSAARASRAPMSDLSCGCTSHTLVAAPPRSSVAAYATPGAAPDASSASNAAICASRTAIVPESLCCSIRPPRSTSRPHLQQRVARCTVARWCSSMRTHKRHTV